MSFTESQLISKPKGPAYEALDSRNRLGNFINTITFITTLRWTFGDPTCPFGALWSLIRQYIITLCPTRKVSCGRFFVAWRDVPSGLRDKIKKLSCRQYPGLLQFADAWPVDRMASTIINAFVENERAKHVQSLVRGGQTPTDARRHYNELWRAERRREISIQEFNRIGTPDIVIPPVTPPHNPPSPAVSSPPAFETGPNTPIRTTSVSTTFADDLIDPALRTLTDTPHVETPLVETPLVETPLLETPLVETPLLETIIVDTLDNGGPCSTIDCIGLRTVRFAGKWRKQCSNCIVPVVRKAIPPVRVSSSGRRSQVSEKVRYALETNGGNKKKAGDQQARKDDSVYKARQDKENEARLAAIWTKDREDVNM